MSASATASPFTQYFDLDGTPLSNGSIYFGSVGQNPETAPISVYWDEAMTQPAAQPVKTRNGYTVRNGNIAQVYVASDYSVTVRNSSGARVLYAANSATFSSGLTLRSDLISNVLDAKGSALVGHGGNRNYVAGTIGARLNEWISVKDFPWLAKGDGSTDDATALDAAIAWASAHKLDVHVPSGVYRRTTQWVISNVTDVRIYGDGGNSSMVCYDGAASATAAVLALENCAYMDIDRIGFYGSLPGADSKAGFGVYITNSRTGPAGLTQYNTCRKVRVGRYTDAGFQDGRHGANTDTNTDGNGFIDCFADGSNYNSTTFANVGVRFEDSNTNFGHWIGGAIVSHNVASIECGAYARNITIDGALMFDAGPRPGAGPSTGAHILIRNNQAGPISIKNITTELYRESFLKAEATSGGAINYNLLTLDSINLTANYGIAGYGGTKIIDYQGSGSVSVYNLRAAGSLSDTGVPSALTFRPANAPQGGSQVLKIQGLHLYDGAWLDAESAATLAYFNVDAEGVVDGSPLFIGSINTNTLTVYEMIQAPNLLQVGSVIAGARGAGGVTLLTKITALGTGTGGVGTYTVDKSQTVTLTTMVASSGADYPVFKVPDRTRRETHDFQRLPDINLPAGCRLAIAGHQGRSTWKVAIPYYAWTAAATSQQLYIATLPAGTQITAVRTKTTTGFAGTAGTLNLSVGVLADGDLLQAHIVSSGPVNKGYASADLGAGMASPVQGGWVPDQAATRQVYVKLASGSGNLGNGTTTNLTAGYVTVYLTTEVEA